MFQCIKSLYSHPLSINAILTFILTLTLMLTFRNIETSEQRLQPPQFFADTTFSTLIKYNIYMKRSWLHLMLWWHMTPKRTVLLGIKRMKLVMEWSTGIISVSFISRYTPSKFDSFWSHSLPMQRYWHRVLHSHLSYLLITHHILIISKETIFLLPK